MLSLLFSQQSFAEDGYVGTEQCIDCHKEQYNSWKGSDHDMSMRHASPESVLGNFDNQTVMFEGKENKFFKKGDEYWVNIEGPDGQFHDYRIKYTFAYKPLQQYMVEFDDGRVQLIPFAWGAKEKAAGKEKWFHLYPDYEHYEDYFWTNTGQNWNYMCADCHSTNVKKNYDLESNTYNTTFSEINAGCESCHGPAENHMQWSKTKDKSVPLAGFDRDITKQVSNWVLKEGASTLTPESVDHTQQTLVCAQCHSRRTQISEDNHIASNEFGDKYLLELINSRLYYPDGQIYDEDFVYGSFLQSKMHESGVVCSNCHDPHKAELAIPKEAVCLQCHLPTTYAQESHHHHEPDSEGAQCTNCHMAQTTYMEVDDRADHAWHSPTPENAKMFGSPDTCLSCHEDKDSEWSSSFTGKWYPKDPEARPFAPVFAAASNNVPNLSTALSEIAQSTNYSNIIRGSALERMVPYTDTNTLISIARGAKHEDSNVRIGAIRGAVGIRGAERWRIVAPLLKDKVLSIRTEAAITLAPLWPELSADNRTFLTPALNEYMAVQDYNADRGYAHTNKGNVFTYQSENKKAEDAYRESIRIDPFFATGYLNLADLYRKLGNDNKAIETLELGFKTIPNNGMFAYSIGLSYIRKKDKERALQSFKKATELNPDNANFHYVYGLSIQEKSTMLAQKQFQKAFNISGNPQYLYALCDLMVSEKSFRARQCVDQLKSYVPANVIEQLEARLNQPK